MLGKYVLQRLRSLLRLSRRAALISRRPPDQWFRIAVLLSRLQWGFYRLVWWRPDILLRTSVLLDVYLHELSQLGEFPIPWQVVGAEHLSQVTDKQPGGVLYCAGHVPFFSAHARVLLHLDAAPSLVIALAEAIDAEGGYPLPGLKKSIPALPPGTSSLVRVYRALQAGGTVGSMIDAYPGGPLRPQLFRLAGKTKTRILFLFSELDEAQGMKFTVALPPYPVCDTEDKVQANLKAYDGERRRILTRFRGDHPASQPRSG